MKLNARKLIKIIYYWHEAIKFHISASFFWLNSTKANVFIFPFNESRKLRKNIKELIKEWKAY